MEAETLSESLELYRDLSEALRERIRVLKSNAREHAISRHSVDAIQAHFKALQTVIDLEDSLARQASNGREGSIEELDLNSARAEIASRLSVWATSGTG